MRAADPRPFAAWAGSAVENVEAALARIAEVEPAVRAWVLVDADGARAAARRLDAGPRRLPLHGLPVGVKDVVDVAGLPTGCGSPLRAGRVATADAAVVARLRAAGAVVVGKTVTTEFAYFEPGPTRNPHDLARTPGGSSSGSAAAVAAGMVPLAVGTQTAGSVIRPASFCGIAGLATARGALAYDGIHVMSPTLDAVGLFTADVDGLAVVHAALGGSPVPQRAWPPSLLVVDGRDFGAVEPETAALFEGVVGRLGAAGAWLRPGPVDPRWGPDHRTVMATEIAAAMGPERDAVSAVLAAVVDEGAAIPAAEVAAARARAARARTAVLAALDNADAVVAPAAPGPAPEGIAATGDPALNRPWQLLGLPAVAVPGLRTASGLPVGIAVVGRPGAEHRLLSVAGWVAARL